MKRCIAIVPSTRGSSVLALSSLSAVALLSLAAGQAQAQVGFPAYASGFEHTSSTPGAFLTSSERTVRAINFQDIGISMEVHCETPTGMELEVHNQELFARNSVRQTRFKAAGGVAKYLTIEQVTGPSSMQVEYNFPTGPTAVQISLVDVTGLEMVLPFESPITGGFQLESPTLPLERAKVSMQDFHFTQTEKVIHTFANPVSVTILDPGSGQFVTVPDIMAIVSRPICITSPCPGDNWPALSSVIVSYPSLITAEISNAAYNVPIESNVGLGPRSFKVHASNENLLSNVVSLEDLNGDGQLNDLVYMAAPVSTPTPKVINLDVSALHPGEGATFAVKPIRGIGIVVKRNPGSPAERVRIDPFINNNQIEGVKIEPDMSALGTDSALVTCYDVWGNQLAAEPLSSGDTFTVLCTNPFQQLEYQKVECDGLSGCDSSAITVMAKVVPSYTVNLSSGNQVSNVHRTVISAINPTVTGGEVEAIEFTSDAAEDLVISSPELLEANPSTGVLVQGFRTEPRPGGTCTPNPISHSVRVNGAPGQDSAGAQLTFDATWGAGIKVDLEGLLIADGLERRANINFLGWGDGIAGSNCTGPACGLATTITAPGDGTALLECTHPPAMGGASQMRMAVTNNAGVTILDTTQFNYVTLACECAPPQCPPGTTQTVTVNTWFEPSNLTWYTMLIPTCTGMTWQLPDGQVISDLRSITFSSTVEIHPQSYTGISKCRVETSGLETFEILELGMSPPRSVGTVPVFLSSSNPPGAPDTGLIYASCDMDLECCDNCNLREGTPIKASTGDEPGTLNPRPRTTFGPPLKLDVGCRLACQPGFYQGESFTKRVIDDSGLEISVTQTYLDPEGITSEARIDLSQLGSNNYIFEFLDANDVSIDLPYFGNGPVVTFTQSNINCPPGSTPIYWTAWCATPPVSFTSIFLGCRDITMENGRVVSGVTKVKVYTDSQVALTQANDFQLEHTADLLIDTLEVTPTTGPTCDSIDFNNDGGFFDPQDINAFLSVFSEGPCIPDDATCNDIDFNNDGGFFDPCDINAFLLLFSEGPCTPCGA